MKGEPHDSATARSPALATDKKPLLVARDIVTQFHIDAGVVRAVDGVSFEIAHGRTLGIVGESGCGKSVTSLSLMRLIQEPPGKIESGTVELDGRNLLDLTEREMCRVRGNEIAMIFQEPMTSLNPVFAVGAQIAEALREHRRQSERESLAQAARLLDLVGIPDAEKRAKSFPHEMSGGMKQRVMIAMALSCEPNLLIADEPTTALDVTIQAQILDLLRRLQRELGMAICFISHNLGVIAEMAHEVAVMYAGRIVERADVVELFGAPRHPYTIGLFHSIPRAGRRVRRLDAIPGVVPNPLEFPEGCRFHPRCPFATQQCRLEQPELVPFESKAATKPHLVACHRASEVSFESWHEAMASQSTAIKVKDAATHT